METSIKTQLSDVLLRSRFRKEDAGFVTELLDEIDQKQELSFMQHKEYFLNKDDKVELIEKISDVKTTLFRSIYIVGVVQFIAIVASVLAIVNFMLK